MQGYDIIGDVHGCASQLERLLAELGYRVREGAYLHPERQAIFVGDLVDRGSEQLRVLQLVKPMVDNGNAQIVMGNHEFNAICYATRNPANTGRYLRRRTKKNTHQHQAFLKQLTLKQRTEYIRWFATLPLWLDLGDIRVVHACWHTESMEYVAKQLGSNRFSALDQFARASTKGDPLYTTVEILLKGPEISLTAHEQPAYRDKDGHPRANARIRWWDDRATTLREIAEIAGNYTTEDGKPYPTLPDIEVDAKELSFVYTDTVPVFFGHYWRRGKPQRARDWTAHCACVDFSVAKGGEITAYRWSGENTINPGHYVQLA
ncbi:metallophosphoesterase [Mycobacterium asiaticum]|uniref:Metallophosphatase n=1 Tax=Mycobacterium asiaticum TaxID=1790 RepID=A0A1A3CQA7_MYCAS|nr:metallophosphoesterase [Mycobacterium asiaticum]OBI89075.1 metallophosphatase [Mycobacterium asiaticum]